MWSLDKKGKFHDMSKDIYMEKTDESKDSVENDYFTVAVPSKNNFKLRKEWGLWHRLQ